MAWDDEYYQENEFSRWESPDYGGGQSPYLGGWQDYVPSYGGGSIYSPRSYTPAQMMGEIEAEEKAEKEWRSRGSAGAPQRGSSSYIVSGGPTMYGQGTQTLSTRPVAPALPTLNLPSFKMPEYDEAAVRTERQKVAAPYLRTLRQNVQKVMAQSFENPNVKRMTLRDALGGYGTALESVMGRAEAEGRRAYGEKYSKQAEEAKTNYATEVARANAQWQAEVNRQNLEYQNLLKEWMAQNYGRQTYGRPRSYYDYND